MPVQDDFVPNYDNVGFVAAGIDEFLRILRPWKDVKAERGART
jgi:hypothetical protein